MDASASVLPPPSAKPFTQIVDGFPLPGLLSLDCYRSALNYKPRPDDLFIATYPKCGTTWAQHILFLLFNNCQPIYSPFQLFAASPYLEFTGAGTVEKMPRPGAIKTHLPYHLAPRSDKAKYIYITRNPKDCCVSYFHHMRNFTGQCFNGSFEQFFELFISGTIDYGDYFDNLLGWYAHKDDPNVLFLTYEQMKENTAEAILKMASFIDDKLYGEPLRNDPEKLKNIIQLSSFSHMNDVFNKGVEKMLAMTEEDLMKLDLPDEAKKVFKAIVEAPKGGGPEMPNMSNFVRKGIIGDWKNYFTEEQSKRLEEKFTEKTKGTDIKDLWKKYMK